MLNSLPPVLSSILQSAEEIALQLKHEYVGTEHVLYVLCGEAWPWSRALADHGLAPERILGYWNTWDVEESSKSQSPLPLSPNLKRRLGSVIAVMRPEELETITAWLLLLEILAAEQPRPRGPILEHLDINFDRLLNSIRTPSDNP